MATDNPKTIPAYAEKLAWLESHEVPQDQRGRRRAARAWAALWPVMLAIIIVLAVWQLIHLSGWKKEIFPGPGATLANLWDQLKTGLLWHAIGTTAERAVIGFGLAAGIGAVIGALVSRIRPLRAAVGSLITGLQTMPSIAWFPFAIILFGISTTAILFVIVLGAAPSIANGLIDQDQSDMQSATAIIIVILVLGILVHALFSLADRSIRRRWGLTGPDS